jgi:hypothetical protein
LLGAAAQTSQKDDTQRNGIFEQLMRVVPYRKVRIREDHAGKGAQCRAEYITEAAPEMTTE